MKAKLLGALLLTPVVALVDWQVIVFSWWYVVWLGVPVVGVSVLVAGRLRRSPSRTTFGVALVLSGVIGGVLARYLNMNQIKANQDAGGHVVAALAAHWQARGCYPESLAELVPSFMVHLPVPAVGVLASVPWWYTPSKQKGGFALGYQATPGVAVFYSKGKWSAVPVPWQAR